MNYFIGETLSNESELKKCYRNKRKNYYDNTVKDNDLREYLKNGWEILRENKYSTRIRKYKSHDVLFEDRVWILLYKMGFTNLNKDRNFRIKIEGFQAGKQIDVIGRDDNNVFIIECKSSEEKENINARDPLELWNSRKKEITTSCKKALGRKCGRINLVVAINSYDKREIDNKFALSLQKKNIFLWSIKDIEYIENLIKQVGGESAKYQLYSFIFYNKPQKDLKKEYPAIRGKIGESYFYSFLMKAKDLLKYSYVHHRDLLNIPEASKTYQRMLKRKKLDEIAKFIDEEYGYFPNSIIINFSEKIRWDKKETHDEIQMGILTMPSRYSSTWIIDGQHRLYGAAKANRDVILPVLAFDGIDESEQAKLFVDINEKQTAVPRNLLWDLYSDIYRDSKNPKQLKRFYIAETAKIMQKEGPLSGHIDIASNPSTKKIKYTLSTICTTIEKYAPWKLISDPYKGKNIQNNIARIINCYFGVLKELWGNNWKDSKDNIFLTNNGFGVFFMVFGGIIKDIEHKENSKLLKKHYSKRLKEEFMNYLSPAIKYLKNDKNFQNSIRKDSGRGSQSLNAAIIEEKIMENKPNFWTTRLGKYADLEPKPEIQKGVIQPEVEQVREKANKVEKIFREFVLSELKINLGDVWWKEGVPPHIKNELDRKWQKEIGRNPHLNKDKQQNERKFCYLDLGNTLSIVEYKKNWSIFEQYFGSKSDLQRRIKDIMVLRNPIAHHREIEQQDIIDGTAGLLWLSRNIESEEIYPYLKKK